MAGTAIKSFVKYISKKEAKPFFSFRNVGGKFWKLQKEVIIYLKILFIGSSFLDNGGPFLFSAVSTSGVFPFSIVPVCTTLPHVKEISVRPNWGLLKALSEEFLSLPVFWGGIAWHGLGPFVQNKNVSDNLGSRQDFERQSERMTQDYYCRFHLFEEILCFSKFLLCL